jgi:hypothetical protein
MPSRYDAAMGASFPTRLRAFHSARGLFVAILLAGACVGLPADPGLHRRETAIRKAIAEYREHRDIDDWQARVEIDERLVEEASGTPAVRLAAILHSAPDDLETGTAVAVCLGRESPDDSPQTVVALAEELFASRFERVRYRAAAAMTRRSRRGAIGQEMAADLLFAVEAARNIETSQAVADALWLAERTLKKRVSAGAR